jgi:hypothetical protein
MFDRFRRRDETTGATATADTPTSDRRFTREDAVAREDAAMQTRDRDDYPGAVSGAGTGVAEREETAVREPRATTRPLVAGETMAAVRARQRERFGGVNWGSAFFGFLSALGFAAILTAILAAAGVALGLADQATGPDATTSDAQTIGLGGGIALLIVLAIGWYCGGYVAGRMSRFDGGRQGAGVWAWTIIVAILIAAAAAVGGSKYDVFQSLNLPSLPVNGATLTSAGAIAGAAAIVVTLLAAVLGGRSGERYHRRVDRVAHDAAAV